VRRDPSEQVWNHDKALDFEEREQTDDDHDQSDSRHIDHITYAVAPANAAKQLSPCCAVSEPDAPRHW
jgi:hypothetical protein